jgi:precorrin-2 dehydrogenase/sirohydrochlorin ferrochelatase
VWVNSAAGPAGDFHVPATLRRGPFVLAVGTGGAAPSLARSVCARLEDDFDDAFAAWVALLAELRPVVLERVPDAERRRQLFEGLARWEWLERLKRDGAETVRQAMLAEVGAKCQAGHAQVGLP